MFFPPAHLQWLRVPLERFQLFDLKRDEGARTFEAREIATGRPVLVHLFADRVSPLSRALLAKVDALPEKERLRVIDRGDHEGGVYLVTDRLAEYAGLREWLTQKEPRPKNPDSGIDWRAKRMVMPTIDDQLAHLFDTAPQPQLEPSPTEPPPAPVLTNTGEQTLVIPIVEQPPAPAVEAVPVPAPAANDPGEFTRQFAPVLRPAPPPAPAATAPAAPLSNEPGEFTRQFAPMRPTPPAPAAPAPPAPAANEPGEFTRQFAPVLRPAAPPAQAATEAPAMKPEQPMGEFTRQFQAPQRPVSGPPQAPVPPRGKSTLQDGEFTQMLKAQRPAAPAAPPQGSKASDFDYLQSPMAPAPLGSAPQFRPMTTPTPPRPSREGEFTQRFGPGDIAGPSTVPVPAIPSNATEVFHPFAPPASPGLPVPPASEEWGKMFETPAALTFGQAPPSPQGARLPEVAPAYSRRNSSRLPLLLIIGGAVLLMIAVIVYFVVRPH